MGWNDRDTYLNPLKTAGCILVIAAATAFIVWLAGTILGLAHDLYQMDWGL